jgi:GTP-binding protein Era
MVAGDAGEDGAIDRPPPLVIMPLAHDDAALRAEERLVRATREDVRSLAQRILELTAADEPEHVGAVEEDARTGLVAHLTAGLPAGPQFFPDDEVSDLPEERWVAELVREQLLAATRDELPYSIATQVVEWEWPRIRVDIIVERESQKGMVIGKGGIVLKRVGEAARRQLPDGAYLELRVKVDKDWQRRPDRVERLGY